MARKAEICVYASSGSANSITFVSNYILLGKIQVCSNHQGKNRVTQGGGEFFTFSAAFVKVDKAILFYPISCILYPFLQKISKNRKSLERGSLNRTRSVLNYVNKQVSD